MILSFCRFVCMLLGLGVLSSLGGADSVDLRRSHSLEVVREYKKDPDERKFFQVLSFLQLANQNGRAVLTDYQEVLDEAYEAIIGTPGYEVKIERKLEELRLDHLENRGGDYDLRRQEIFVGVSRIRSSEIVALLIRLLEDGRDGGKIRAADGTIYTLLSNSDYAGNALIALIDDLPLRRDRFGDPVRDVSALQQWGASVVDGSQTFRFKGDPRKFTIHGPVEPPARVVKASPVLKTTSEESDPAAPNRTPALILAMVVLLAAVAALLAPRICKANRG